jgi:hypothetical protein
MMRRQLEPQPLFVSDDYDGLFGLAIDNLVGARWTIGYLLSAGFFQLTSVWVERSRQGEAHP